MPPTLDKRILSVVFAALVGLLAAGPAQAAKSPKIKRAYAVDADRDGHVDAVSLKWSKKVRGKADSKAPFAIKVRGYRVTSVGAARRKNQKVQVAEGRKCDTGGSVRLSFRPRKGAAKVKLRRGKKAARKHKLDMRRFDVPTPRITCAVTLDSDADGHVDGVRVTYSREVRSRAQKRGRFLFSVAGYDVKRVRRARGRFLKIDVAEHASPDSGTTPAIGYSRPSKKRLRRFSIRAGRRKNAFPGSFRSTRDGVSPRLVSGQTGDADRDGLLDAMTLRFSEPVAVGRTSAFSVLGMQVGPRAQVSGANVTLSLVENTARGDARPGAWIADNGVTDLAGNDALRGAVAPADEAPPVITAAVTQDTGGTPGQIDAVMVRFSEPVAHPRDAGGAYPFLLAGRDVTSVEPAGGFFVQVRIAETGQPDTGERPSVRYIPGSGLPVADVAGNDAAEGFTGSADGVAPVLLSAETTDADSDGKIGSAVLRFSEDVLHGAEGSGSSFSVSGYDVTTADAADGDEIAVTFTEKPVADSGATPSVEYTRDGVEDVRDAAGNPTGDTALTAADGARPVLLSVATGDVDDDGRLDRLATTWSESLTHADDTSAPFALSASGITVTRVRAASGTSLDVDLAEPGSFDTGSKPNLTYLGGSVLIRDAAGLQPTQQTWAGLTVDALDPRVVSATTGDSDSDGELDSIAVKFSEPVVHAQEATPGSFTAGLFTIMSAEAAVGDTVELKLQQSGTGDTGVRPAVSYTPDGSEDVRDAAGNFAPSGSITQAADGARPVPLSAATADVDDDGELDRVTTGWSEPLVHADDSASPFPLSAESFTVARIHAAAGQTLDVDLTEQGPDTGSAPDLTYTGGADPITDAAGLEPAQTAHSGLTQDALPPRRVSTATVDADFDGKLDAVDVRWSETVTGSTASTPFSVTGRALGANVTFNGATTRVPFAEDPAQFDTDATPQVSYDAVAGDLHDVAEGTGDTTADAPAVMTATPDDKAAPILVAAKTADLSTPSGGSVPNGTIDAVLTTFSEPISHLPDSSPFSLNVAGRNEQSVEGDSGAGDKTLYVVVSESGTPDGGETPNVSVTGSGIAADRIKDLAPVPNEARVATFTGTTDEVRPVLMSAQLGERGTSGGCTKTAVDGIDGEVDCVLATWSEQVEHAEDLTAPFSITSTGWPVAAAGIGALSPATTLEIPLTASGTKDRDRAGETVSYDDAIDTPVVDTAAVPNESLNGTKTADPACKDTGLEGNDTRDPSNPDLETTSPSFQRKCAFDQDWYTVRTTAEGYLDVLTRPSAGVDIEFNLVTSAGSTIGSPAKVVVETGAAGQIDRQKFSGLAPSTAYHLQVTATDTPSPPPSPQEGPYCVVFSDNALVEPGCGPLVGQIVFTEVGFGNDKFVEIKNDFEVPVDMDGAGAQLIMGPLGSPRATCTLELPTGGGDPAVIDPNEHVLVLEDATATAFGCPGLQPEDPSPLASLPTDGERLELSANGAIDVVDFTGIIDVDEALGHSLQFVEDELTEDADANNDVDTRWCRTFAADTKGAVGDGCDEYRINEVLFRPQTPSDGKAFVELAGNLPALANSELLGGWVLRGVNGRTGKGTDDFVLPATASPRSNGTYVIADGDGSGGTEVAQSDVVWDFLDLDSSLWPDDTGVLGPRGLQLLRPDPPPAPPCTSSADAFGWDITGQNFAQLDDDLRGCDVLEGQKYATATAGASASRDNLSDAGDTTYNENLDTGNNQTDFYAHPTPSPAALNIRP